MYNDPGKFTISVKSVKLVHENMVEDAAPVDKAWAQITVSK